MLENLSDQIISVFEQVPFHKYIHKVSDHQYHHQNNIENHQPNTICFFELCLISVLDR